MWGRIFHTSPRKDFGLYYFNVLNCLIVVLDPSYQSSLLLAFHTSAVRITDRNAEPIQNQFTIEKS